MEDGEGGDDDSKQEGAEEGRRPMFRKIENHRSSQEVLEHMKTHIPTALGALSASEKKK